MRLFLSETFFDAVFKLPKKIQDKVVAFQRKFREDNTSAGIHLEPIAQFKNSTLRTARVDDNYRVVVGVLDGENYSLLYVGDHEDAYRWGKISVLSGMNIRRLTSSLPSKRKKSK